MDIKPTINTKDNLMNTEYLKNLASGVYFYMTKKQRVTIKNKNIPQNDWKTLFATMKKITKNTLALDLINRGLNHCEEK